MPATGKISSLLALAAALCLLAQDPAAAAENGRLGLRSSATGSISLSIPVRADLAPASRAFIRELPDENGEKGAYAVFCLRSNLDVPLHVASPGAISLPEGECDAGETGAAVPLPAAGAEETQDLVLFVDPF